MHDSIFQDHLDRFVASLPGSYRQSFDATAVAQHFRVAELRGESAAHVGVFDADDGELSGLCVVADDRPGLLAYICEALLSNGLDVVSARAYNRELDGATPEAIDLFWVRSLPTVIHDGVTEDVAHSVRTSLLRLLRSPKTSELKRPSRATRASASPETLVRFIDDPQGAFSTLEIETGDRSGLLLAITSTLAKNRVQIVGSLVSTRGSLVFDRFQLLELDGAPIEAGRRRQLQLAVLLAIDPAEVQASAAP